MRTTLTCLIAACAVASSAQGAAIVAQAINGSGISFSTGPNLTDDLTAGNLVRIGYFTIPNEVIAANQFNLTLLNQNFVEFGTVRIGENVGNLAGHFQSAPIDRPDSDSAGFAGKQVYLWVFGSTNNSTEALSFQTAFEQGIFSLAGDNDWIFPDHDAVPNTTLVDLNDLVAPGGTSLLNVPGGAQAQVVVGSFPKGTSETTGSSNFALAVVPEPSTAIVALLGGTALLLRRRRQS